TSTLSRVENGKMPDMETFLALCDWLEVPPASLIKNDENKSEADESNLDASEALAIQLRADKNLDPATANALAELVKAAYANLPKRIDALHTDDSQSDAAE
ncbi:MAG: helix-turn-helix transcriptional regulator, partial [Merismopedia sp. SIO2A8]|nr:helix-turn-helix transcriptional regulator [Merismopedia sp. SIO2A8]